MSFKGQPVGTKPTVLGIERCNNPHIIPIFDELGRRSDLEFTGCVLQPLTPQRVALGWPEIDENAPYLQLWRGPAQRARYFRLARSADVVIWPGLKHPRGIRTILKRILRRKLNILWAERFALRRRRPWYEYIAMRLAVRMVNSTMVHLMTMGHGADVDYRRFGATRWINWEFGYAIEPVPVLDHDLQAAPDGVLRLLFAGELCERKGVDLLLRALGTSGIAAESWKLAVVGGGPDRGVLERLARNLGIADRVDFAGVVDRNRMGTVYGGADVLVLPSRFDGWGAVLNEAMEHGLAIVASDAVGAAHTLVEKQVNGFVFPSEDVDALAACLDRLANEPGLCAAMRRASRERIEQFRPAEAARRLAALCRGLTGRGPMPHYETGLCRALS